MQSEVKILTGQNMPDIAIQETGYLEGIFCIAITNGISMTEELDAGNILIIDDDCRNARMYRQVKLADIKPATNLSAIIEETPALGGIEYMAVEIDFIVS